MTTVWLVVWIDRDGQGQMRAYDTANQANTHADTIRRQGLGAHAYPADIHD